MSEWAECRARSATVRATPSCTEPSSAAAGACSCEFGCRQCDEPLAAYGHPCHKETWLYFVGDAEDPPGHVPRLDWRRLDTGRTVSNDGGGGRDQRSRTPPAFRDVLLAMARSAAQVPA